MKTQINIDQKILTKFCHRNHIKLFFLLDNENVIILK